MRAGLSAILAWQASVAAGAPAQESKTFDAAAAFGARPSASTVTLSPNGMSVAYIINSSMPARAPRCFARAMNS